MTPSRQSLRAPSVGQEVPLASITDPCFSAFALSMFHVKQLFVIILVTSTGPDLIKAVSFQFFLQTSRCVGRVRFTPNSISLETSQTFPCYSIRRFKWKNSIQFDQPISATSIQTESQKSRSVRFRFVRGSR